MNIVFKYRVFVMTYIISLNMKNKYPSSVQLLYNQASVIWFINYYFFALCLLSTSRGFPYCIFSVFCDLTTTIRYKPKYYNTHSFPLEGSANVQDYRNQGQGGLF